MNIFENRWLQLPLLPVSWLYGLATSLRNYCYEKKIFKIHNLTKSKVVSIGNIAAGGTGKTPFTIFLAKYLRKKGIRCAVLSRGYRRKSRGTVIVSDGQKILARVEEAGDEPFLMAQNLSGIPVVCEQDRHKGASLIEKKFQPQVIILDDGFQHRRLSRDLDIVLFDASRPEKSFKVLPAGYLREPLKGLMRADLLIFTRINHAQNLERIAERLKSFFSGQIILSDHKPTSIVRASDDRSFGFSNFQNKEILLFSGISNPLSFEFTVKSLSLNPIKHLIFPDHYNFTINDLKKIERTAKLLKAKAILTTEKDFIRLLQLERKLPENFYYLKIEMEIVQGMEILEQFLKEKLGLNII